MGNTLSGNENDIINDTGNHKITANYLRDIFGNLQEDDLRFKNSDGTFKRYKVNMKRACCLGALNYSSTPGKKYIEIPISYYDENNPKCPLKYTIEENGNTVLYKEGNKTLYSKEYLDDTKTTYKFFSWINGEKNDNPEYQLIPRPDGKPGEVEYSYFTKVKNVRYYSLKNTDSNGETYYTYFTHDHVKINENIVKHLENKDAFMDLSECLSRKSLHVDL